MDTRRAATAVAIVAAALLSACATPSTSGGSADLGPSGGSMTSPVPSSPGGSPSRSPTPIGEATMTGEVTMKGEVQLIEIEGGCLVLRVGDKGYQLMGGDRQQLRPGATVTVKGRIRTDVMTTCQVGPVLEVTEVRPG